MSHIQIVPQHTTHELVAVLKGLRELAESGDLTGIVFGVVLRGQRYYCDSAGSLHRNPIAGIGVATRLVAELDRQMVRRAEDTIF